MRPFKTLLFVIVLFSFFSIAGIAKAGSGEYTKLFYYRPSPTATKELFSHPASINIIAPQTYYVTETGTLVGSVDPAIVTFAIAHQIKIMPLATNGSFQKSVWDAIVKNKNIQQSIISALVQEGKKNGFWGWQIDFESINAEYRNQFTAFITNLATALHANGLKLSVAVVAKTSDIPAKYPPHFWQNVAGVFDYSALASQADFLSIMSYDDPFSRGPIVEYPWLKAVINYSLSQIPAEKISLGIPLYYWQWNNKTGRRIGIGGSASFIQILKAHAATATFGYSQYEQEPFFRYGHTTVWYENNQSLTAKINLIKKYHLYGLSAWRLGLQTPAIFSTLQ